MNLRTKLVLLALPLLFIAPTVSAHDTLYDHYIDTTGRFPTIEERAEEYRVVFPGELYTGSYTQNTKYLEYLETGIESEELSFGATFQTPETLAFFEDSLAASIDSDDTSFNLVSGKDKHGNLLASSTYGFILDEGTANEEIVLADCTTATCTNVTRGLSVITGTSTVSGAAKAHRRGASVKITDAPILLFLKNVVLGKQNIENLIRYDQPKCTGSSASSSLCDKNYVDNVAVAGAATSSESQGGIVRLATQVQMASSTDAGADDPLVLQAKYATSTYPTAQGLYAVITQNNGLIDPNLISTSSDYTWTGSTTIQTLYTDTGTTTHATSTDFAATTASTTNLTVSNTLNVGTTSTTTAGSGDFSGSLKVDGSLTLNGTCLGCGPSFEASVAHWTGVGDTITGSYASISTTTFRYDPSNFSNDVTFRFEAVGGHSAGSDFTRIALATTTAHIISGTELSGFSDATNGTFAASSDFTTSVMPAATDELFCVIKLSTVSGVGRMRMCRLVAIITQ